MVTTLPAYQPTVRFVRTESGEFVRTDLNPRKGEDARPPSFTSQDRARRQGSDSKPSERATVQPKHTFVRPQYVRQNPAPTVSVLGQISNGYSWVANQIPDRVLNVILAAVVSIGGTGVLLAALPANSTAPNSAGASNIVTPQTPAYRINSALPESTYQAPPPAPVQIAIAPQAAPIQAPPIPRAAPPIAPDNSILHLGLDDGYVQPNFSHKHDIAAMNYILKNEGVSSDSYTCSMDAITIGVGYNISANPKLFARVTGCSIETANQIASGEIENVRLSPEANGALFAGKYDEIKTIVINKCRQGGVDFNSQPPRVKLALMDLCYVRPNWLHKDMVRMLRVGNYAEAAFEIKKISNYLAKDHRQTGTADRAARACYLVYNATKERGQIDGLTRELTGKQISYTQSLAPIGINPAAVPHRAKENLGR